MLKRYFRKFSEPVLKYCKDGKKTDSSDEIKLQILLTFSLLSFLLIPRSIVMYYRYFDFFDAKVFAPFIGAAVFLSLPIIYKHTQSLNFCGVFIASFGMALIHAVSLETGGIFSYSPYAMILLVSIVFLLCNLRTGLFFWCLTFLEAINLGFGFFGSFENESWVGHGMQAIPYIASISTISLVVGLTIYAFESTLIKEKRLAEKKAMELENLYEKAKDLSKSKDQFLSTMSHEFRTPLNGIIGNLQLLRHEDLNSDQVESTESIRICSENLLTIVNDLLDYSKIQSGEIQLENNLFKPEEIYEECKMILRGNPNFAMVDWKLVVKADCPKLLVGDRIRFRQILLNLLSNALKFTKSGTVTTSLIWSHHLTAKSFHLSVKDTGIGIHPSKLSTIFEPFCQADSTITRRFGGTGLGLALCRKLVLLFDGQIEVKSTESVGTIFNIWLPLKPYEKELEAITDNQKHLNVSGNITSCIEDLKSARILVAEDDEINRRTIERLLLTLGVQAQFACDGQEAFHRATKNSSPFDLLLMDIQMPVMDGIASTTMIRKHFASTCQKQPVIVALTANALKSDFDSYEAVGIDECLSKPIRLEVLKELLQRHFAKKAQTERQKL